jgi:hypothetical protein
MDSSISKHMSWYKLSTEFCNTDCGSCLQSYIGGSFDSPHFIATTGGQCWSLDYDNRCNRHELVHGMHQNTWEPYLWHFILSRMRLIYIKNFTTWTLSEETYFYNNTIRAKTQAALWKGRHIWHVEKLTLVARNNLRKAMACGEYFCI